MCPPRPVESDSVIKPEPPAESYGTEFSDGGRSHSLNVGEDGSCEHAARTPQHTRVTNPTSHARVFIVSPGILSKKGEREEEVTASPAKASLRSGNPVVQTARGLGGTIGRALSICARTAVISLVPGCSSPEASNTATERAIEKPAAPQYDVMDSILVRMGDGTATLRDYEILAAAAYSGDYQAQRNFAWWLSGRGGEGAPLFGRNPILSCAWRIVIITSGSPRVDQSDTGNKEYACERTLDANELAAATAQASVIADSIGKLRAGNIPPAGAKEPAPLQDLNAS